MYIQKNLYKSGSNNNVINMHGHDQLSECIYTAQPKISPSPATFALQKLNIQWKNFHQCSIHNSYDIFYAIFTTEEKKKADKNFTNEIRWRKLLAIWHNIYTVWQETLASIKFGESVIRTHWQILNLAIMSASAQSNSI